MADDDWKKRVGVEINYSSGSEGEDDLTNGLENYKLDQEVEGEGNVKSLDEEHLNAILDEDEALGYYQYGSTPPRTRILERMKEKSFRKREERASRSPVKVIGRSKAGIKQTGLMSADFTDGFSEENAEDEDQKIESTKKDIRKRKRSMNLLRESERDMKRDSADFSTLSLALIGEDADLEQSEERSDSVPLFSFRHTVKTVETCKRFLCLTSKPVSLKDEAGDVPDGPKPQPSGCPQNRVEFYKAFSRVIKLGNTENKNYGRQRSQQEQMWQNEVKDLLWLELKAWHADCPVTEQDTLLCIARQNVTETLNEILAFRFDPSLPPSQWKGQCDSKRPVVFLGDTFGGDSAVSSDREEAAQRNPFVFEVQEKKGKGEWHKDCFDVFCQDCTYRQNLALGQVEALLHQLDLVQSLYPSSKALGEEHPLYLDSVLTCRLHSLCSWHNVTTQLRLHIDILGRLLTPLLGSARIPWPCWQDYCFATLGTSELSYGDDSASGDETSSGTRHRETNSPEPKMNQLKPPKHKSGKPRVQFMLNGGDGSPDSGYGVSNNPSDSNNSTDSGSSGSASCHTPPHLNPTCEFGNPFSTSHGISPYRKYVEKLLKTKGLRKMLQMLDRLFMPILLKTRRMLAKKSETALMPDSLPKNSECCGDQWSSFKNISTETCCQYKAMGLPSFRGAYLFLCRIPLDVVHECLKIRLEQKPEKPSPLSIRQLMRECKEALKAAVVGRRNYMHMIRVAIFDMEPAKLEEYKKEVEEFDSNVKAMLQAYLEYLQQWINMIQQDDSMICSYQKNLLEEEWSFVKATCPHIPGGEVVAGDSFCRMASSMLGAIGDHLGKTIEELISAVPQEVTDDDDDHSFKHVMLQVCRESQSVFHESREHAIKAIAFAKTLRKDLEISAEFSETDPGHAFLQKLKETNHVRVLAPQCSRTLIFIPMAIKQRFSYVCHLLDMHYGCDWSPQHGLSGDEEEGYLLLVKDRGLPWDGDEVVVRPTDEAVMSLSNIEVQDLLLVVCSQLQLVLQRRYFQRIMGEVISIKQEHCAPNQAISGSLVKLKNDSLGLCGKISNAIGEIEVKCDLRDVADLDEMEKGALLARCRDTLHQCYKFGFEYHKEVSKLVTGEARRKLAAGLIAFAKQWMIFAEDRCERGRGIRPRWANQGLDFLITVCDPQNTMYLKDEEFEELQDSIDKCISHVIGSADNRSTVGSNHSRGSSPSPLSRRPYRASRSMHEGYTSPVEGSRQQLDSFRTDVAQAAVSPVARRRGNSQPGPVKMEDSGGVLVESLQIPLSPGARSNSSPVCHMEQIHSALTQLEKQREEQLREEGVIGEVVRVQTVDRNYHRAKSATFSWQRGIKIGQGRFGKVYTAVNNQTGELMAMKEIQLQPNDHCTVRTVYEELRIFEGIHHRHLVRHYGVEVHRDEMLIFMEYCAEGTLESVAASTEEGLPEALIRRYTHQLLLAVSTLHDNGIVHRDIKSANIFLTDDGNCLKLGDFGCAVKIRAHTTMPGELRGFVGTQAYMAPEVFTKNTSEGHGRAADIWSAGCVVIEMAAGKRPWHELESNYQIMFKVGTGERPPIPENLSEEGVDFIDRCLQHDPRYRDTAAELLGHNFVKVDQEDECLISLPLLSQLDSLPHHFLQTAGGRK